MHAALLDLVEGEAERLPVESDLEGKLQEVVPFLTTEQRLRQKEEQRSNQSTETQQDLDGTTEA